MSVEISALYYGDELLGHARFDLQPVADGIELRGATGVLRGLTFDDARLTWRRDGRGDSTRFFGLLNADDVAPVLGGDLAGFSVAYRTLVDLGNGHDFRRGPGGEAFIADVKIVSHQNLLLVGAAPFREVSLHRCVKIDAPFMRKSQHPAGQRDNLGEGGEVPERMVVWGCPVLRVEPAGERHG